MAARAIVEPRSLTVSTGPFSADIVLVIWPLPIFGRLGFLVGRVLLVIYVDADVADVALGGNVLRLEGVVPGMRSV
jgi:hypothetical protein